MTFQLEKGLIQVYTGNGKGKSTAAFGLALRSAGNGLRVHIIQFMKDGLGYGEISSFARLSPEVKITSYGRKGFVTKTQKKPEDYALAGEALQFARKIMQSGEVDVLILDEISNALFFELLQVEEVLNQLEEKPDQMEVVLTGRYAPTPILDIAQLVTEMVEIKHPYEVGISSRKGIEY